MKQDGRDIWVLVHADLPASVSDRLRSFYRLCDESLPLSEKDRARVEVIVTNRIKGFDGELLRRFPAVKIVSVWGTGTCALDLEAARARRVAVASTSEDGTDQAVAELALGLTLSVSRRISEGDRFIRAGRWTAQTLAEGSSLRGKVCCIVGMGYIGREIARLMSAIGMTIAYHSRHKKDDLKYEFFPSLIEAARKADLLVIAVTSMTSENKGLVDAKILAALHSKSIVINISGGRGQVLDETALIASLQEGRIGGAGLDVFANEPNVRADLLNVPNLVMTPHIGWRTVELQARRDALVVENITDYFGGRTLSGRLV